MNLLLFVSDSDIWPRLPPYQGKPLSTLAYTVAIMCDLPFIANVGIIEMECYREHTNMCYAMGGMMQSFICLISDLNFQNTTPFLLFPLPTPRVFLASQHEIARFWKNGVLAFFHSPLSQLRFFHRAGNPPEPPQSWQSQSLA